ncbi:MAG: tetratricopeptide repeat protein [Rubrobacteraceae bacterium]|nr:tetratricopeptide repeat protein [Rubrobacteraceae bacterium]MBA3617973.1 tetratricopeptide repeat protein [Rubrobacteraceae bacterium]MDQ3437232.1 tetratricopeptide repeat protein [Actinomycetota bacterium]
MMMNRDRLSFWVRLVAIVLAAFFLLSFIFLGLGTNISYNLFELIGNQDQQQQQADKATDPQEQIAAAEKDFEKDPKDPEKIKNLAALYYTAGRDDDAIQVLQRGREVAPEDEEIPALIGQVYSQQAQVAQGEKQKELLKKAGDAFAVAAETEPDDADAYLLAGQAYDQAGQPADAIEYYNGYLDLEPNGENAEKVKDRISALLEGGDSSGSAEP